MDGWMDGWMDGPGEQFVTLFNSHNFLLSTFCGSRRMAGKHTDSRLDRPTLTIDTGYVVCMHTTIMHTKRFISIGVVVGLDNLVI